jgi:hypothetical protein|tara:strand:+ start:289 stop:588 length:300 start_codon:yes stop_codon:yes gene_type:complete
MIIQTVNSSQFHAEFHAYNRAQQFSYEAREALFDHLEELSESTDEPVVLDVICLCCEWTEYSCIGEVIDNYNHVQSIEDLARYTQIIDLEDGALLILNF